MEKEVVRMNIVDDQGIGEDSRHIERRKETNWRRSDEKKSEAEEHFEVGSRQKAGAQKCNSRTKRRKFASCK